MGALLRPRKLALGKTEPKARTDFEDRFERSLLACYGKMLWNAGDPMPHRLWATDEYPAGCSKSSSSKAAASEGPSNCLDSHASGATTGRHGVP